MHPQNTKYVPHLLIAEVFIHADETYFCMLKLDMRYRRM